MLACQVLSFVGAAFSIPKVVHADLVTLRFTAVVSTDYGSAFEMPVGTVGTGWYQFDINTVPSLGPNSSDNLFAIYPDAIVAMHVDFGVYGSASGGTGNIFIGDPVRTTGSLNFLSDIYQASASVDDGIVVPGSGGSRRSLSAAIFLQDLDRIGLSSEILSATPPDLAPFKDNLVPRPVPDAAELQMNFSLPGGGLTTIGFELTSLTAVPEPSTALLILSPTIAGLGWARRRRRSGD
jgi:hypothetical protein